MEKFYLGFSLGFNASATLISTEEGIVAAISQERLNGQKNTKEFPIEAMLKVLEIAGVKEVNGISYSHYQELTNEEVHKYISETYRGYLKDNIEKDLDLSFIYKILMDNGINCSDVKEVIRVEHHLAHALSTIGVYGEKENSVIVTSDGFGDGLSATISKIDKKEVERVSEAKLADSVALIYQFTTGSIGFTEHKHEGKVTSLAALGQPLYVDSFFDYFKDEKDFSKSNGQLLNDDLLLELNDEEKQQAEKSRIVDFDKFLQLKKTIYKMVTGLLNDGAKREDIAASVQEFAELKTTDWIFGTLENYEKFDSILLAGGLFANIKINQKINKLNKGYDKFSNILVVPTMGDEGISVGSALYNLINDGYDIPKMNSYKNILSGTPIVNDEQLESTDEYSVKHLNDEELTDLLLKALVDGKLIALCRGRMEFGARALSNRSIIFDSSNAEIGDRLGDKLGRDYFLPYGPILRNTSIDALLEDAEITRETMKFMNIAFNGKQEFLDNYPTAFHVDLTVSPQVIYEEDNKFLFNLLEKYEDKTGLKTLVNTSFNPHGETTPATYKEAISHWKKIGTDILVLENFVLTKKGMEKYAY